jgi:hypothetical protein
MNSSGRRRMHMPGEKLVIKTKFYNQLKPEIILIPFKTNQFGKTSALNVQAVCFSKLLLHNYRISPYNAVSQASTHQYTRTYNDIG